jgi:hypothetical protein
MADKYLSAEEIWELLQKKFLTAGAQAPEEQMPPPPPVESTGTAPTVGLWYPYVPKTSPFVTEVIEPEPEEDDGCVPPTCRYFVPNQQAVAQGAELPETWPYNKAQEYHACTNPKFNAMGKIACEMVENQSQCVVFSDTESRIVDRVVLTKKNRSHMAGELRRVSLIKQRYGLSMPIYHITAADANADGVFDPDVEDTILHIIDGAELQEKTKEVLDALWTATVSEFGDAHVKGDMPAKPKPPSYLKELVTV